MRTRNLKSTNYNSIKYEIFNVKFSKVLCNLNIENNNILLREILRLI